MSGLGSVFKYYSFRKKVLDSFREESIYFSHVDQFNDPFEGRLGIVQAQFDEARENQVSILAEYFSGGAIKQLRCNEHNFNKAYDLSRSMVGQSLELPLQDRMGVVCFTSNHAHSDGLRATDSERPELNRLMWSHYASCLAGFCVEFDPVVLLEGFRNLNPGLTHDHFDLQCVQYTEKRFLLDAMDTVERYAVEGGKRADFVHWLEQATQAYFQKSAAWSYEREVRIVGVDQARKKVKFSASAIKNVFIGYRMQKSKQTQLVALFKSLGVDSFMRVHLAEDSFLLPTMQN